MSRRAALAYGIPFISGKDSLHNQFTDSETGKVLRIPNTLLIAPISIIDDVRNAVTMDFKVAGPHDRDREAKAGKTALSDLSTLHRGIATTIAEWRVAACHDVSDGGAITAIAEMAIASGIGADVDLAAARFRSVRRRTWLIRIRTQLGRGRSVFPETSRGRGRRRQNVVEVRGRQRGHRRTHQGVARHVGLVTRRARYCVPFVFSGSNAGRTARNSVPYEMQPGWYLVCFAIFLIGVTKSGFGSGLGLIVVPIMALATGSIGGVWARRRRWV